MLHPSLASKGLVVVLLKKHLVFSEVLSIPFVDSTGLLILRNLI